MNRMKGAILTATFAILLAVVTTPVRAENDGVSGAWGPLDASGTNKINPGKTNHHPIVIKGSPSPKSPGPEHTSESPQNQAVTPGGLETTPGGSGANISNTPSNITPATTPPLQ